MTSHDSSINVPRRQFLVLGLGAAAAAGLSGCSRGSGDQGSAYPSHLNQESRFMGTVKTKDGLTLQFPLPNENKTTAE